jgi:hypothetical protein
VPKILLFAPGATRLKPGERTDLNIGIEAKYPPHELLFNAINGSYNRDPEKPEVWYFRAGPDKGTAEVALTVVNNLNLMATKRSTIMIETP